MSAVFMVPRAARRSFPAEVPSPELKRSIWPMHQIGPCSTTPAFRRRTSTK